MFCVTRGEQCLSVVCVTRGELCVPVGSVAYSICSNSILTNYLFNITQFFYSGFGELCEFQTPIEVCVFHLE